jgi:hypothetical protein
VLLQAAGYGEYLYKNGISHAFVAPITVRPFT